MKKYILLFSCYYYSALSCAQLTNSALRKSEQQTLTLLKDEVTVLSENITHKTRVINESNSIIKRLQKETDSLKKEKALLQREITALTAINQNLKSQISDLYECWD